MSNIYNLEPATKGKVLLYTSHGDIEIELWSREAPKACRNFVQLCLEGYYDNVIFHRLVKGFCIQGGDPTGTGTGGESIYPGNEFKDEFHQRLKFNRRGLVAMANNGNPHSNTSQFFFTLGEAPELQKKHTIFGKVAGNTIYNVLRMEELDTDNEERPLEPPFIKKTEILNNPFDDITVRDIKHGKQEPKKKEKKKKSQMKATKNFKLLSFGEEAEDDEEQVEKATSKIGKIASAHDKLTTDTKLSSQVAVSEEQLAQDREKIKSQAEIIRNKLKKELEVKPDTTPLTSAAQQKLDALKEESNKLLNDIKGIGKEEKKENLKEAEKDEHLKPEEKQLINSFRKDLKEYKTMQENKNQKTKSEREKQSMTFLQEFTAKLKQNKTDDAETVEIREDMAEEEEEEFLNNISLFSHRLVDDTSTAKVKDANVEDDDTYEIIDPRHPINKRKRQKDNTKKGGPVTEKWKRSKLLT